MTKQEFRTKVKAKGFTKNELMEGIVIEGVKFEVNTCMRGRYWTVSKKDLNGKWYTLCTRATLNKAFEIIENNI